MAVSKPIDGTSDHMTSPHRTATCSSSSSLHLPYNINENDQKNIRRDLLRHAEKTLGVLGKHLLDQWNKGGIGVDILEVRVEVLLALVQVAIILQHSKTAYQLSLQALRLLQSVQNEALKDGRGLLGECDVHLWLESRCWMVRSVVGLLNRPGGVAVLSEGGGGEGIVREVCGECVEVGEVELMAEVHLHAALHGLSLSPSMLDAALHHSQVRHSMEVCG